jgi:DNA repair protein RadC
MPVSPKAAIRKALKHNARSVVFVHRLGPDRSAVFSSEELKLVRALKAAASTIDIIVHDHIVTGGGSFKSAREDGALGKS